MLGSIADYFFMAGFYLFFDIIFDIGSGYLTVACSGSISYTEKFSIRPPKSSISGISPKCLADC